MARLKHVAQLDGLRGLAALSVFFLHTAMAFERSNGARAMSAGWRIYRNTCDWGSYGVDVFFVLSGFLITTLLIQDRSSPAYYRNFYWKRVLRIQPVFLLSLAALWMVHPESHTYVLLALVFLANFSTFLHVPNFGPPWTLAIEEQFYLVWPLVVRKVSPRRLYWVAFFTMLGCFMFRSLFAAITGHAVLTYTFYRLDGLGLGALLACQWAVPEEAPRMLKRCLHALNSRWALVALFVLAAWTIPHPVGTRLIYQPRIIAVNFFTYRLIRFILLNPSKLRWMQSSPLVFMGNISYSFYLFHELVLVEGERHFGPTPTTPGGFAVRCLALFGATTLLCVVLRHAVEIPAHRLRRFVLRAPSSAQATTRVAV